MCDALSVLGVVTELVCPTLSDYSPNSEKYISGDPASHYSCRKPIRIRRVKRVRTSRWQFIHKISYSIRAVVSARSSGCDIVYTRDVLIGFCATCLGLRTIYESHFTTFTEGLLKRFTLRKTTFLRNLLGLVVITTSLRSAYMHWWPSLPAKVLVAPDGANLHPTSRGTQKSGPRLVAGYTGSLFRGKGVELILKLAARRCRKSTLLS